MPDSQAKAGLVMELHQTSPVCAVHGLPTECAAVCSCVVYSVCLLHVQEVLHLSLLDTFETLWDRAQVSSLERCPYFRGSFVLCVMDSRHFPNFWRGALKSECPFQGWAHYAPLADSNQTQFTYSIVLVPYRNDAKSYQDKYKKKLLTAKPSAQLLEELKVCIAMPLVVLHEQLGIHILNCRNWKEE